MSPFKDDGFVWMNGRLGPVTLRLQDAFFALVNAEVEDRHGRLTYVPFD